MAQKIDINPQSTGRGLIESKGRTLNHVDDKVTLSVPTPTPQAFQPGP